MELENRQKLIDELRDWVTDKEQNGIKQHSDEWLKIRTTTVGGSSIATIQGINPYNNIATMVLERLGLRQFFSNIRPQWGNLFEDVIKRVVEHDHKCEVLGEDLYVMGEPGTSYSPDGLAVIEVPENIRTQYNLGDEKFHTVLMEFKCPFSRIPDGKVPVYYVPQVKMGFEILKIPTIGLFVEGVFRRCSWEQLCFNNEYDNTLFLGSPKLFKKPLAIGIIGVYYDAKKPMDAKLEGKFNKLMSKYNAECVTGELVNSYKNNDLGSVSNEIITLIIDAIDNSILIPYYGGIMFADDLSDSSAFVGKEISEYNQFCVENDVANLGVLPWKLLQLDYNYILKEPGYLDPWMPKIAEIIKFITDYKDPANEARKSNMLESFINKNQKKRKKAQ